MDRAREYYNTLPDTQKKWASYVLAVIGVLFVVFIIYMIASATSSSATPAPRPVATSTPSLTPTPNAVSSAPVVRPSTSTPTVTTVTQSITPTAAEIARNPYYYVGCYKDTKGRALGYGGGRKSFNDCYSVARVNNAKYFGIQNWKDNQGECWYSKDDSYGKYGTNNECRVESDKIVGGDWANAVYKMGVSSDPYEFVGCYADKSNRALAFGGTRMKFNNCQTVAKANKAKYFGIQSWRDDAAGQGECWYSDSPSSYSMHGSKNDCRVEDNKIVGGSWTNAVYRLF